MQRIEADESSDPQVRALARLALELDEADLRLAAFWLEHTDDAGYLTDDPATLAGLASARFSVTAAHAEALRQRVLHGECTGMVARDLRECLRAQLDGWAARSRPSGRPPHHRLLPGAAGRARPSGHRRTLGFGRRAGARRRAPDPVAAAASRRVAGAGAASYVVPTWWPGMRTVPGGWRSTRRPTPRVSVTPMHERTLDQSDQSAGAQKLRELLHEARWLTRGLSIRYDTLLRTARAIVERQAGFLVHGDEAMAPLTLREVADEIGMHESTVSRITSGKYMQTPRGTFELKHFFAVRLEGASVSGAAVRAMVRRLIESEPARNPLADDAIASLLARQGIHIARRTVAKYREQQGILPARARARGNVEALANAG
jgi:RNA polymerase sigma-54 factor